MTQSLGDSKVMDSNMIIRYSPVRYRIVIAVGLLLATVLLAYGVVKGGVISITIGLAGMLFVGLFARGVRRKLSGGALALARDGELLVGGELNQPLPISQTTFEIVSDYEGSWIIVLRCQGATTRLGAGGWRIDGQRFVTKAVAERALLAFDLKPQAG